MIVVMMLACQVPSEGARAPGPDPVQDPRVVGLGSSEQSPTVDPPAPADVPQDTGTASGDTAAVDTAAVDTAATEGGLAVDTAPPQDTAAPAEEPVEVEPVIPLVAQLVADVEEGEFPLVVSFDASGSELGAGAVRYEWDFGDGAVATDEGSAVHTYIGEGRFDATLTLEDADGAVSVTELEIEVDRPDCPNEESPVELGWVDDGGLSSLSGLAVSRLDPDVYWVHEDRDTDELIAIDASGVTLSEQDLPDHLDDFEDVDSAIDPVTGVSWLFLGDIGDNNLTRSDIAVWVVEEPDPHSDGDLEPLEMELTYPDGPHNAEAMLVDPLTLDLYILTKVFSGDAQVFVKRAPHDDGGPFELESLGDPWSLDLTATGADISADGYRVVVRDYSNTARMWFRDGYRPLEDAFDHGECRIDIHAEPQGEAIGFTADGVGVVTLSEGSGAPLFYIEL